MYCMVCTIFKYCDKFIRLYLLSATDRAFWGSFSMKYGNAYGVVVFFISATALTIRSVILSYCNPWHTERLVLWRFKSIFETTKLPGLRSFLSKTFSATFQYYVEWVLRPFYSRLFPSLSDRSSRSRFAHLENLGPVHSVSHQTC